MEMPNKVLSEQEWAEHVNRVAKFKGSMAECCRQHALVYESLRIRKRECNKPKPASTGSPQPLAFVKVEPARADPVAPKEPKKSYPQLLPDPEWLARFIHTYVNCVK